MKRDFFDKCLGEQLFQARVIKRITQEQMADAISIKYKERFSKKCGISRSSYTKYEKGERSMNMGILICACEYLGLDYIKVFENAQKEELKKLNEKI